MKDDVCNQFSNILQFLEVQTGEFVFVNPSTISTTVIVIEFKTHYLADHSLNMNDVTVLHPPQCFTLQIA